ncbi:MAG: DUF3108 domain-containing protein [Pyrinomonadaceae bacterium]
MKAPLRTAQLLALLIIFTATATAQRTETSQAPFNSEVYRVGERLTYNVNYSHFVSAAHVELLVAARGKFFDRDGIQLRAHVETTGVVNVAVRSINNDYTTYVYPENGLPYRAQQVVRQAGRTTQASVDYNQPAGTAAIPPKLRVGEFAGIFDLLSALYRVRAMPLSMGSKYFTTVRNENVEYEVDIKVIGKQTVKTSVGSFDAIVTRLRIKDYSEYDVRVYFSDDEWHVPVLLTAVSEGGAEIQAELAASAMEVPQSIAPNPRGKVDPALPNPTPTPGAARVLTSDPVRTPAPLLDLPFKVGEQLNYQVYLGKSTQPVGTVSFTIKNRGRYFNRDGLQFSVSAQTNGSAIIAVRDQITSYVDPVTLLPFRTEISFSEGKYKSVKNYNLDQDRGAATSDVPRERIEIPVGTHDILSAFYALRTFTPTILKQNAISIMAVTKPRALLVTAQRRETIELNGQKINAIVLELKTDDSQPDRMQIRIWVGDDARRLPLRIAALTETGALRADLVVVPSR